MKDREGVAKYRAFVQEAADLVVRHGGSMSGEHGDGQSRGELLHKMFGEELVRAFGEFKAIWDPLKKMNPGKVVDAYRLDENLRYGAGYELAQPETHFRYPADNGSLAYALERCVGVGKCRRTESGVMCPSYMVTREEMHSTRGRARLLFEMLRGSVIGKKGWRDEAVKESLDLCLSCKGCKSECPVSVDMATYKAEFLSHYYEGRLRPRAAYSMGLIYWWARLASKFPAAANFLTGAWPFRGVVRWVGGIAPEREMPRISGVTFREWFAARPPRRKRGPEVMLWPDTFTNFFEPEIPIAAVGVLEAAGFRVKIPAKMLCCGRPLYDFGMLVKGVLEALESELEAGTPIVGLEPGCVSVFRDELGDLFPGDARAGRLKEQTFTLAEFLRKKAPGLEIPRLERRVIVHGHCHHKSIMGMSSDREVFEAMGLDYELLNSGCCGMAGAFGFQKENYGVSVKCAERVLLPAVEDADAETLLMADGFSCRQQIGQLTGRKAAHLAQVLQAALPRRRASRAARERHEENLSRIVRRRQVRTALAGLAVAGVAAAGIALARRLWRR